MTLNHIIIGILLVASSVNCRSLNNFKRNIKELAANITFDLIQFSNSLENEYEIIDKRTEINSNGSNMDDVANMAGIPMNTGNIALYQLIGKMENIERALVDEKQYVREKINANRVSHSDIEAMVKLYIDKEINSLRNSVQDVQKRVESNTERINEVEATVTSMGKDALQQGQIQGQNRQRIENLIKAVNEVLLEQKIKENNWQCHLESCYFVGHNATWAQSKQACEQSGAFLVEVNSEDENTFLVNFAISQGVRGDYGFYLGLSDLEQEGTWIWATSGRKLTETFNNFKTHEPNGGTRENCLHLFRQSKWKWNDTKCDHKMGYICEVKKENIFLIKSA